MPTTAKELSAQIDLRRARFESIVSELSAVLVDDLPNWAMREAKEAFLASPNVAGAMSGEALRSFKADVEAFGQETSKRLQTLLAPTARWMDGSHLSENPRTLADAEIWSDLNAVVDQPFDALLQQHGLRGQHSSRFKGPVYFVGGRYFPALAEHYWKLRAELVDLEREVAELSAQETRTALLDRWDNA